MPFSSTGPAAGPAPPARSRSRLRDQRYKWVQKVRNKYLARPWVGHVAGGVVYLGFHATEEAAWRAIHEWVKAGCHLDRGLPAGVLPKWVVREEGGTFGGKARFAGRVIRVHGKATAGEAHRAVMTAIERVRVKDGWFDEKLPAGIYPHGGGYGWRCYNGPLYRSGYGPFRTPKEAAEAMAGAA